MLTLQNITLQVGKASAPQTLLRDVSLHIPSSHLTAIVGPAGSGKSTLVKVIAGLHLPTAGTAHWEGRDLAEHDLAPYDIGYVPQFSIAFDHLTVWESMQDALRLRVKGLSSKLRHLRAESILREVGIFGIADRRVRVLSGGEKRRLSLALELVSYPSLLIADEVTSGLDPKSEEEIMSLMHRLSRNRNRIVLSIIHNLRHISLCDSVVVMNHGSLVYHGPTKMLLGYFHVNSPEEVFPKLTTLPNEEWHKLWLSRRAGYDLSKTPTFEPADIDPAAKLVTAPAPAPSKPTEPALTDWSTVEVNRATPGALMQFLVLVERRWRIFFRDPAQVWLHLALLFGFPCLVVIFALQGLPQIQNLGGEISMSTAEASGTRISH